MQPHENNLVHITCAPGLVPYLQQEVEQLGYAVDSVEATGVEVTASLHDCMKLNLHLRTAFAVLYLLREFPCTGPDELYNQASACPWEELIPADGYVSIVSRGDTQSISNWTFASLKVKDAIVDRMAARTGRRPDSGPDRNRIVIHLFWRGERAALYLNTSGNKLADRGYRRIPHKAPMQETLAAGVILATGYDGSVPLVNPMCGSGTLAIEAALIATRRAPGLLRSNFGFLHAKGFDAVAWEVLRREARSARAPRPPTRIIATDIDDRAVEAAGRNAATAGVDKLIEFDVCDFADTPIPPDQGIIILNPEYGERLGTIGELEKTYARIGDFFKQKCAGHTGYVFTGNPALAKKIGLRASRRLVFFNAKIECRLLKYELYEGTREKLRHVGPDPDANAHDQMG